MFHNVKYTEKAIESAVNLSSQYIADRFLPDKAIDLIDEAGAKVKLAANIAKLPDEIVILNTELKRLRELKETLQNKEDKNFTVLQEEDVLFQLKIAFEKHKIDAKVLEIPEVNSDDIAQILSTWTGVPVNKISKDESENLLQMENILHKRVVGQDHAVASISKAIRRARLGLRNPNRPIASFIFAGTTGVGKTELAKTLASYLFNDENALTRLAEAVSKIGNYTWPQRYSKTVKEFFKRVSEETGKPYDEKDLQPLLKEVGFAARMIGATLQNTANPTMLDAGYKANVIPGAASAVIYGRFIPGFEDELNETIKSLIGPDITVETITRDKALEFPFEGDLVEAMCNALIKEDSVAIPVPYVMSGGTDNKALSDLGIVGFGFSPVKLPPDLDFFALFHGVDERIPIDGLKFGVKVLNEFLQNS